MTEYRFDITLTNEDEGTSFARWDEPIEDWLLTDDGTPDFGHIYRVMQSEYGACRSSVYVDRADGPPMRVGWFFVSRQKYEDTGDPYLRGAWVTIAKVVAPAQSEQWERVEVSR